MSNFDRVVIKNATEPIGTVHYGMEPDERHVYNGGNVHIVVHPFKSTRLISMDRQGVYESWWHDDYTMPDYQKRLADVLWASLPGLSRVFFSNGEITLQHHNVFSDDEIYEAAVEIIRPVLEQQLQLSNMLKGVGID